MNKEEIVRKVKNLGLPTGSFVVFGSCPMAIAGIRESQDIDLLVTPEILSMLSHNGWKQKVKSPNDKPLVFKDFEAHDTWNFSSYKPTLDQLLATAVSIEGIPFASLEEVKKWKTASGRPKDLADIKLINEHLKNNY